MRSRQLSKGVPLTVLVDEAQRRALRELAAAEDRSVGSVVRRAVDEHLGRKQTAKETTP